MNVRYYGSRETIASAAAAFQSSLRTPDGLTYLSKDDRALHTVEEITVSEGAFEKNPPLKFGEWRYSLSGSRALIEGSGLAEVVKAIGAFLKQMELGKESPIPSGYAYGHSYHVEGKMFSIDGIHIQNFGIYYQDRNYEIQGYEDFLRFSPEKQAAFDLADFIGSECGTKLSPKPLKTEETVKNAIVLSSLEDGKRYGDWKIKTEDTVLFLLANDVFGLESAVSALCKCFRASPNVTLPLSLCGSLQKREEYENDPDAFLPCYEGRIQKEVLSIEEKAQKLSDPQGEAFVIAHRGEHTYYPENSLEAALSAWRCGADSCEVDLSRTRDGIFVLMHDETLARTTDVAEKKGKNGLPDSEKLCDWSLDQLRQLRLRDTHGQMTDFFIPTLEELCRVCDGRIFLHLDKKFDYQTELFPLIRKWGTYRCFYLCNYIDFDGIVAMRGFFADQGITLPSLLRIPQQGNKKLRMALEKVLEAEGKLCPAVVFMNDYSKYLPFHKKLVEQFKGKLRIASWMMWETDSPYYWQEANDVGFNVFMTNFPIRLMKHLS